MSPFSRLWHCRLDFSAAPVNSVKAEETATFSRHCGYNRGSYEQAGSLQRLCGCFRRVALHPGCRLSGCRSRGLCSGREGVSTHVLLEASAITSSILLRAAYQSPRTYEGGKHAQKVLCSDVSSVLDNH